MSKSAASLTVGLITRRIEPSGEPTVPPLTMAERAEFQARIREIEAMPSTPATPDAQPATSLSAALIGAGRHVHKAERQRRAELGSGSGYDLTRPDLEADSRRAPQAPRPRWSQDSPTPMPRVAAPELPPAPDPMAQTPEIFAPSVEEASVPGPPRDLAGLPGPPVHGRRKSLTLRLTPLQHTCLADICRGHGCSFQGLVMSSLEAFLDDLDQGTAPASVLASTMARGGAEYLGRHDRAPDAGADVHYFQIAQGWRVAVWRDEDEAEAVEHAPAEALSVAVRDESVAELLGKAAEGLGKTVLQSAADIGSSGDRRVALTIRLDEELHRRLLDARRRLAKTSQTILIEAIDAHLARL